MKKIRCCFIKEQYFIDNSDFINMLDSGNVLKQSQRTHLCIELKILGIPSFVAYDKGEELGRFVSQLRKTEEEVQSFIDSI